MPHNPQPNASLNKAFVTCLKTAVKVTRYRHSCLCTSLAVRDEGVRGSGGRAPGILKFGSRWSLHDQVAVHPGKELPASTQQEVRWAPQPVSTLQETSKISCPCRKPNYKCSVVQPVDKSPYRLIHVEIYSDRNDVHKYCRNP